jgi:fatty acid kinase fatty acid binding subunit
MMLRHGMRLGNGSAAIVLDTASDLTPFERRAPNWRVVPLNLTFGDVVLHDYVDITPTELYKRMRETSDQPLTSVPSPAEFTEVFAELGEYERVFAIHPSAKLSGTYNSSVLASEETGGRVVSIDSETVSGTIVLLADAIQRRLESGTTDDDVSAVVDRFRRKARFVYTVETLKYLARGGRIGRVSALAGGALNTRPLVAVEGGVNVPVRRVRGRSQSLDALAHEFTEATPDSSAVHFGVSHADARDEADAFAERLRELRPNASFDLLVEIAPALGSHLGPGALGVFWFVDAD